jgi:hypothetical protein
MNQLLNWLCRSVSRGRPNRRVFTSLALLLLAIDVPIALAQHVANPFVGATQYVNPDYAKEVNSAIATVPAGSTLANQMSVVATYPTAVWLDRMAAIAGGSANNGRMGLQQHIEAALAQQKGTQPIIGGLSGHPHQPIFEVRWTLLYPDRLSQRTFANSKTARIEHSKTRRRKSWMWGYRGVLFLFGLSIYRTQYVAVSLTDQPR